MTLAVDGNNMNSMDISLNSLDLIPSETPRISQNPNESIHKMLEIFSRLEKSTSAQADILEEETKRDFRYIDDLHQEKLENISTLETESVKLSFWKSIVEPLRLVGSAASVAYNIPKLRKGKDIIGPALFIASGVSTLAAKAFSSLGLYQKAARWVSSDEKTQTRIAGALENSMKALNYGLSGAAICYAYKTGMLHNLYHKTTNFADHLIGFRNGSLTNRCSQITACISDKDSLISQTYHRIHDCAKSMQRMGSTLVDTAEKIKQFVDSYFSRI